MANGPQDYRDPKVTTTERRSSMGWLWWVLGAILLLLLLGWLLGWFAADEETATVTEPAATEETATTTEPAATDDAAVATDAADDTATEGTTATEAAD